ncbi:MAG: mechanosensitive ion channel family protein, partial [Acidobacteriota bacterium]|nr:mechanosensitive ion channel family protein [Acidobacteriota bacterium]
MSTLPRRQRFPELLTAAPRLLRTALLPALLAALLTTLLAALLASPSPIAAQEPAAPPVGVPEEVPPAAEAPPPAPLSEDARLGREVYRRLEQIPDLQDWHVEVTDGVAQLGGTALTAAARDRAEQTARDTIGITAVDNRLTLPPNLEERVVQPLLKLEERGRAVIGYLPLLAVAALLILFFAWLAAAVARWDLLFRRADNPFVQNLSRQLVRAAVFLVGVLLALEILDATALVGAVLGTAGVLGIAIGFAFRDMAENFIASVLLSLRQPFAPNDLVRIDDLEGKVVSLTSRATILMTLDGNHLRIPNSRVFKGVILNYTRNPLRRFDFGVGVGVEEDLVEAQRLGIETLRKTPGVVGDPEPWGVIDQLGDSSVVVRFYAWVDQQQASFAKVRSEAIRLVKLTLEDAGMDLPEPIYRLKLEGSGLSTAPPKPAPKAVPEESQAARKAPAAPTPQPSPPP